MEVVRLFLESSTIHGLAYVSKTSKYAKLFWILVVIAGFTVSGFLIKESFQSWSDSPIKTTVESLPVTKIRLPKVTVCPPKNTFTDLNYDLMLTEDMKVDIDTRNELTEFAMMIIQDHMHEEFMSRFRQLDEENRFYNWYQGISTIVLPYYRTNGELVYDVSTRAKTGKITTEKFGEPIDKEKVRKLEREVNYNYEIWFTEEIGYNENITLNFNVEFNQLPGLIGEEKRIYLWVVFLLKTISPL